MSEFDTSASGRRDFLQAVLAAPVLAAALADTAQAEPAKADTAQGPTARRDVFVKHAFDEHTVNLGEVVMNYVVSGRATNPALLLIPGQTESWWGFEKAIALLDQEFQVFAVDLRGQGRTTWTPRRYTLDNMGNDLVRFIALVIKRPVITSGCSSGGVLSAWLSAFAMPGQLRGAHYEDPPLFASETNPLYGQSIRQTAVSASFQQFAKFLGDQWSIGDWKGLVASRPAAARANAGGQTRGVQGGNPLLATAGGGLEPPQTLKEYDPEWARAFLEGTVGQSCPHERMLAQVNVPVLFTHHGRAVDPATGQLSGALSDLQATKVQEIVRATGQPFEYVSLPDAAHAMHQVDPARFAQVLTRWARTLPA
jgi:pimeloyl-ACP methyl ester carboxylesterase